MLRLKQSEHSYFAFRCIDLLPVTENQMTLNLRPDVSKRFHIEHKKEVRNYDMNDQNS